MEAYVDINTIGVPARIGMAEVDFIEISSDDREYEIHLLNGICLCAKSECCLNFEGTDIIIS